MEMPRDNDHDDEWYYNKLVILKHDQLHNVVHEFDNDINLHHHHGTDHDILIHDHDESANHNHLIEHHNIYEYDEYGPSDHNHHSNDDDGPVNHNFGIRIDDNDPYGHDDGDNLIDNP
jgi:hypothetical protein